MAMQTVTIIKDILDKTSWQVFETDNVCDLVMREFSQWPETARIYHEQVSKDRDVTPYNEATIERLKTLEGRLYVVVYPGDPVSIIIAVVAAVATAALSLLLMPSIPPINARNIQQQSPNNALSDRQNSPRPNQRIPDIFGTVRSTPDLLAVPYKIFKNNLEVEVAYFCIGRGSYDVSDIRDDSTPAEQISGMSVEIYGPNTSPLSGDPAQLTVGDAITDELLDVKRSTAINGQTLYAPNYKTILGHSDILFKYPNEIHFLNQTTIWFNTTPNWSDIFDDGDIVTITGAQDTDGVNSVDLDGTYEIISMNGPIMYLDDPASVNSDWNDLTAFSGNDTGYISPLITAVADPWAGPVDVFIDNGGKLLFNLVALNGMFRDDGERQTSTSVDIEFEVTSITEGGTPLADPELFTSTIVGSATTRATRGKTVEIEPSAAGWVRVRCRRSSNQDLDFDGQVVDEVKARDLYVIKPVPVTDFGDVTTAFAVTYATDGALALKERKLNMLVTRKIPARTGETTFGALTASNSAADIICAMALDNYIGNRDVSELSVAQIYDTIDEITSYFGTENASQFCYTFDDDNVSFEETIAVVCSAIFSVAYRVGSKINLSFEKETDDSLLLFNHRNKLPGSEKRTVSFGRKTDYDGVLYEYIDPSDDSIVTLAIPSDGSAVNPKKVSSAGVRNYAQAYFNAWRIWNKIRYQNTATEFDATQEADLLVINNRILVSDNTRPDTQDGEILAQDGLELTLSQPTTFVGGVDYQIFIQHVNGTVEAIEVTAGGDEYTVILADAPSAALSLDPSNFAVATYEIVGNNQPRNSAFLVTEKNPKSNFTVSLGAINYDARYYERDLDLASMFDNSITTFDRDSITWDAG